MTGFTFLYELGAVSLNDRGGSDPFVYGDWFQLAKSGTFFSPVYGKVTISPKDLATMERNFREVTPLAPTQLPIDYDHKSDDPTQHAAGEAKAAGWIDGLQLRNGGTELWCKPKWTRRAAEMISAGEYRFVSPYFLTNYLDKATGKKVGPTLKAAAITNRPFLEGMQEIPAPAIAASDTAVREFGSNRKVAVPVPTAVIRKGIRMKEEEEAPKVCPECEKPMDECTCEDEGEEEAVGLACPQCGAPVAHESKHAATKEKESDASSILDGVKKVLGDGAPKKEEKKMSEVTESKETQELRDQIRQLSEKNAETEKVLKALQAKSEKSETETLVNLALSEGKITPKIAGTVDAPGWARSFAAKDPEGFKTWLTEAPKLVEFGERGTSKDDAVDDATSVAEKLHQLVEVKMSENSNLPYADATKRVLAENRALADQYDRVMIGDRTPASAPSNIRRL